MSPPDRWSSQDKRIWELIREPDGGEGRIVGQVIVCSKERGLMKATCCFALVGLALAAAVVPAAGQARIPPRSAERAFQAGGHVWLDLSAATYRIKPGRDDRVWVEWSTDDPDDIGGYKVAFQAKGRDLVVVTKGPKGSMSVVIEVPARSDLTVDLGAGDLFIGGIKGNKDIGSWAGNVNIEVGDTADYKLVDARVTAGDLTARPFNVQKGGLFRSFTWEGKGPYTMKVRLTAGDLNLR